MKDTRFAERVGKVAKSTRGRTAQELTPIAIRNRGALPARFPDEIRHELAAKLGHAATLIERGTVRFEDVNGPRGGIDTVCRIKLVLSGRPSVQVEETGADPKAAFALAIPVLVRALGRVRRKHRLRADRRRGASARAAVTETVPDAGEIIGRRVGRGSDARARALARPEKERRDAYVDTARAGVSASDRRAGGPMTARRNTRGRTSRATATLEDSRAKPSRKSTRRSANRGKPSQGKERAAVSRSLTPSARAGRAGARRR